MHHQRLRRYFFWSVGFALASLLATGCGTVSSRRAASPKDGSVPLSQHHVTAAEWPAQKITEAHAHYAAAIVHEMDQDPEAALREYYQAALNDPENESLVLDVSARLLQQKQLEKALDILVRASERPRVSAAIDARLGLVYQQLGRYDQAVAADRAAIIKSPAALAGYQNLCVVYLQKKQPQEAVKVLDEAARQPDPDVEFLVGLGELYASLASQAPAQKEAAHARGLAVLTRAEKLKPAGTPLRLKLADSFNLLGESSKAVALKFLDYAPMVFVSAGAGKNIDKIFRALELVAKERRKRIGTSQMNKFLESVDFSRASVPHRQQVKIFYMTQAYASPPTFILFTDKDVKLHFSYERFLQNQIRQKFGFVGTPIWIKNRPRTKVELGPKKKSKRR